MIRVGTGFDLDSALKQTIAAHRRFTVTLFGIAGATKLGGNLLRFDLLAYLNRVRDRVNASGATENRSLKALVNHPAELDVIVGKHSRSRGREDKKDHQCNS